MEKGSIGHEKDETAGEARPPADGSAFDVVFGFDMETDIGSFTPFYEGVKHGTPHMLKLLEKARHPGDVLLDGPCGGEQPGDGPPRARRRARNRLPRPLSRDARRSDLSLAQQLAAPAVGGGRPAARGHADRAGGERRPAGEFPLPASLGQHEGAQRAGKTGLRGRRLVPAVLLPQAVRAVSPVGRRIGRSRAGCGSWRSPISAT